MARINNCFSTTKWLSIGIFIRSVSRFLIRMFSGADAARLSLRRFRHRSTANGWRNRKVKRLLDCSTATEAGSSVRQVVHSAKLREGGFTISPVQTSQNCGGKLLAIDLSTQGHRQRNCPTLQLAGKILGRLIHIDSNTDNG